jgi:hypothetical protein
VRNICHILPGKMVLDSRLIGELLNFASNGMNLKLSAN